MGELKRYFSGYSYKEWLEIRKSEQELADELANLVRKIKESDWCSLETAENVNDLLHKNGLLPDEVSLRFKPLYGKFDFVYSSWLNVGEMKDGCIAGLWSYIEPDDYTADEVLQAADRTYSIWNCQRKLERLGRDWKTTVDSLTGAELLAMLIENNIYGATAAYLMNRDLDNAGVIPKGIRLAYSGLFENGPMYCFIRTANIPNNLWDIEEFRGYFYEAFPGYFDSQKVTPEFGLDEVFDAVELFKDLED